MAAKAGPALTALTALALIAGCGASHPAPKPTPTPTPSATPSIDAALTAWAKNGGLDKIDAITTDLSAIHDAGSDATMVRDGCAELETSVAAAQFYKPVPQAATQKHWAAALTAFKTAAGECLAGIDENKPALLQKTSADLDKGTTELAATTKTFRLG
jgi:hypothetical protein